MIMIIFRIRIMMETFSKYSKGSGRPAPGSGMPSATSTSLCNEHDVEEDDDKDGDEYDEKDDNEDDIHDDDKHDEEDDEEESHRVAIELKLSTRMRSSSSLLEMVFVTDTVQLYMIGSA